MTYNVEFSLEAAAELLRIAGVVGSAAAIRAADSIRRRLEGDPEDHGNFLSEGLYSIDEEPIRAFFTHRCGINVCRDNRLPHSVTGER